MITRSHPQFSLCGLNCSLCPRYNSVGPSRCLGCGATNFNEFHPTCAIMTCNNKKDKVAFCFQCSHYPCEKYRGEDNTDSFISYAHRKEDLIKAKKDVDIYLSELSEKSEFLSYLLANHNDGRSKNFYCLAINNLQMEDLDEIKSTITETSDVKEVKKIILDVAQKRGISVTLRK